MFGAVFSERAAGDIQKKWWAEQTKILEGEGRELRERVEMLESGVFGKSRAAKRARRSLTKAVERMEALLQRRLQSYPHPLRTVRRLEV